MVDKTQDRPGLADSLRDNLHDLSAQAREQTAQLAADARRQVRDIVRRRKDRVAARIEALAAALRDAGRRLSDDDDERAGRAEHAGVRPLAREGAGGGILRDCAESAARQVERASSYVRDHEMGDLVEDLEETARAHPVWFLGGSFAAGVLLARFLKSSGRRVAPGRRRSAPPTSAPRPTAAAPHAATTAAGAATRMPPGGEIDLAPTAGPWPNAARRT